MYKRKTHQCKLVSVWGPLAVTVVPPDFAIQDFFRYLVYISNGFANRVEGEKKGWKYVNVLYVSGQFAWKVAIIQRSFCRWVNRHVVHVHCLIEFQCRWKSSYDGRFSLTSIHLAWIALHLGNSSPNLPVLIIVYHIMTKKKSLHFYERIFLECFKNRFRYFMRKDSDGRDRVVAGAVSIALGRCCWLRQCNKYATEPMMIYILTMAKWFFFHIRFITSVYIQSRVHRPRKRYRCLDRLVIKTANRRKKKTNEGRQESCLMWDGSQKWDAIDFHSDTDNKTVYMTGISKSNSIIRNWVFGGGAVSSGK